MKKCKICNSNLINKNSNAKTCSNKCRSKLYYINNKNKCKTRVKNYYINNLENKLIYEKQYKSTNKVKIAFNKKVYYNNNKDSLLKKTKEYQKYNSGIINAKNAKYRATKLKATLPGYDEEIKEIYCGCPKGYHVHHIIPLQQYSDIVCGLHVPWNLVSLSKEDHIKAHELLNKTFS